MKNNEESARRTETPEAEIKCSECGVAVKELWCPRCDLIYCPYCGCSESSACRHVLASRLVFSGTPSVFDRSPFGVRLLPYCRIPKGIACRPVDARDVECLGQLSSVVHAYPKGVTAPPDPIPLFEALLLHISVPFRIVKKCKNVAGGLKGRAVYFSPDPERAGKEIALHLDTLRQKFAEMSEKLLKEAGIDAHEGAHLEQAVYGEMDGYLVFIRKDRALELRHECRAVYSSRTWGQFRKRIGPERYRALVEQMHGAISFLDFCWEELKYNPRAKISELRRQFREMPIGDRLPEDNDPFDLDQLQEAVGLDYPGWPAREALDWVPDTIIKKYGKIESSVHDGEYLTFDPEKERKIVSAFRKAGFHCVRDEKLVSQAHGDFGYSWTDIMAEGADPGLGKKPI